MFNKKKKHWFKNKPHYRRDFNGDKTENGQPPENPEGNRGAKPRPFEMRKENRNALEIPANSPVQNQEPAVNTIKTEGNTSPNGENVPDTIVNTVICQICNMPIRNHYTAVHHKESGNLVHFDCVLRDLSKEHYSKLGRYRRIYYIGAGNFAIVKEFYDKRGHLKNYEIIERISYEAKEK